MNRMTVAALAVLVPLSAAGASVSAAEFEHTFTVDSGETVSWTGEARTGTHMGNIDPTLGNPECDRTTTAMCEQVFLTVPVLSQEEIDSGIKSKSLTIDARISNYAPCAPCDFDMVIYDSNAEGELLDEIHYAGEGDPDPGEEHVWVAIGSVANPTDYFIVEIRYWAVVQSSYDGQIKVS